MSNEIARAFLTVSDISSGIYDGIPKHVDGYKDFVKTALDAPIDKSWIRLKEPQLLWKLPKLALLLSDSCIMFGCGGPSVQLKIQHKFDQPFSFAVPNDMLPRIQGKIMWPGLIFFQPSVVTTWIKDAESLIADGKAVYVPERGLMIEGGEKDGKKVWDFLSMHQTLPLDALLPLGYYGQVGNTAIVDSAQIAAPVSALTTLMDIALPFVDAMTLADFYKMYQDEQDSVALLRKALRTALATALKELKNPQSPQAINTLCSSLKNDVIEPELAKLNLAYQRVIRSKSFSVLGATVSTIALSAAALLAPSVAAYVALLGGSGAVLALKEFSEFQNNREALRENRYYLLWKMRMTQQ